METEKTACHRNMRDYGIEMAQSVEKADASGDCEADPHPLISEETRFRIRHHKRELNNREGEAFPLCPLPTVRIVLRQRKMKAITTNSNNHAPTTGAQTRK